MTMNDIPNCPDCGTPFDNIFEATDHLLEDDESPFDPVLILPNGYQLMVGSLLRHLYLHADDSESISRITQETYATLYAAEHAPNDMQRFIENLIVGEQMKDIDEELLELLDEKPNDNESGA